MRKLATELKIGDLVKRDGFTLEILSEPKSVDFELYKSDKQVQYDIKYVDFNSTNAPYKSILQIREDIKKGEYKNTYVMFRKTTYVNTVDSK